MAHVQNVSASRVREVARQDYYGPMPALSNPKADFIQSVRLAFQNYLQEKRLGM